jgi:4-carboxymuconolactone decarboxylase
LSDRHEPPGSLDDAGSATLSLVSAGHIEQLSAHIPMGMASGLTQDEIIEDIIHIAFFAGWPRAVSALTLAQKILAD